MSNSQSPSRIFLSPNSHNSQTLSSDQLNLASENSPASHTTPILDTDIESLNNEQRQIDSTINFLLNYNPKKEKPGRPPKSESSNTLTQIPDSVPDHLKSITDINDLHPGVLLDYLIKVNNFNKKILGSLNSINRKYDDLNLKFESHRSNDDVATSLDLQCPSKPENQSNAHNISIEKEDIQLKLDDLEQRQNSNIVLVSGASLSSITTANNSVHHNNLKSKLVDSLVEKTNLTLDKNEIEDVIAIGKEKNNFKVICRNIETKSKILNFARINKPKDVYFSEFLTSFRSKLFYEARQLKKNHPSQLIAVYTRRGNIFYKVKDNLNYFRIRKLSDIVDLRSKLINDSTDV